MILARLFMRPSSKLRQITAILSEQDNHEAKAWKRAAHVLSSFCLSKIAATLQTSVTQEPSSALRMDEWPSISAETIVLFNCDNNKESSLAVEKYTELR